MNRDGASAAFGTCDAGQRRSGGWNTGSRWAAAWLLLIGASPWWSACSESSRPAVVQGRSPTRAEKTDGGRESQAGAANRSGGAESSAIGSGTPARAAEPSTAVAGPRPPAARREKTRETLFGVTVADPYRWLEQGDNPEVVEWVKSQNAYTRSVLEAVPGRGRLAEELRRYFDVTISSAPSVHRTRYFFSRREGLKNHPLIYVREGADNAAPRLLLDPNTFSESGTVAMDWMFPSPDGSLVAYGKSESGSEKSTLYLRDVARGVDLPETVPYTRFCSIAWEPDGGGFYYTRYPTPGSVPAGDENYYRKVFYHRVGTQWEGDPCIYGEGRPKEELTSVYSSSDERHLFVSRTTVWTRNDLFMKDMRAGTALTPVCEGLDALTDADVWENRLLLRTAYQAPRYRICAASLDRPGPENWKEIIPQQEGVIQDATVVGGRLVLTLMENAYSRILVYSLEGQKLDEVQLPTLGTVGGVDGRPDEGRMYFSFESFAYPPTVFRYDLDGRKLEVLDRLNLEKDVSGYETRQAWVTSKDGTKVPMFVVHRKGLEPRGDHPTLLYGYGGFNISLTPSFRAPRHVWLDRGGVFAIANLRGGGEFGQEWHHAGRLANKQNVFDDFIAAAEWLIANGYTNNRRLAVMGGSNGGLLTGAVTVQRPDLFAAVVCQVPLLDMIRYPNYQIARLWMQEYGDPSKAEEFAWLIKYSPYHNVKAGAKYPAVLFETADTDTRVDPMHARKMAALLQASNGGDRPILLRTDFEAGHGAGKPLSKVIEQAVDEWAFLIAQTGMTVE